VIALTSADVFVSFADESRLQLVQRTDLDLCCLFEILLKYLFQIGSTDAAGWLGHHILMELTHDALEVCCELILSNVLHFRAS
jgi:hypothetical protein